jgi:predicted ribosome quality control (RQC) complex YloA/Tae2 family protein
MKIRGDTMTLDGVILHDLVEELKKDLTNAKINRIYQISNLEILLEIRSASTKKMLFMSSSLDNPRIYFTKKKYLNPENAKGFGMVLRKYIERGLITKVHQIENDRILELDIQSYSEMDDLVCNHLIFEIMGRNSNIILTNSAYEIIDAMRKLSPSETTDRLILPHAKYTYPTPSKTINPFTEDTNHENSEYMGCGSMITKEAAYRNISIASLVKTPVQPVFFNDSKKQEFYAFDLQSIEGKRTFFPDLSSLFDWYYNQEKNIKESSILELEKVVKANLNHLLVKKANLEEDREQAKKNIIYTHYGMILQANFYLLKKGMESITLSDYLDAGELITIPLSKLKDPTANLKTIFQKGKKAKITLEKTQEQLTEIEKEKDYLEEILLSLSYAEKEDINDIQDELVQNGYLKQTKRMPKKKKKPLLATYKIDDYTILVGKNSTQNDYLSHTLAKANDLWFHVKDAPGSHVVVLKENHETFSESCIRLASMLAGFYSKMGESSSIPVDYTLVRYLKKIPGQKGYHVTYTNQKTIYIDPIKELMEKAKI